VPQQEAGSAGVPLALLSPFFFVLNHSNCGSLKIVILHVRMILKHVGFLVVGIGFTLVDHSANMVRNEMNRINPFDRKWQSFRLALWLLCNAGTTESS